MAIRPAHTNQLAMAMKYATKYRDLSDEELEHELDNIGVSQGVRRYIYKYRRRYDNSR